MSRKKLLVSLRLNIAVLQQGKWRTSQLNTTLQLTVSQAKPFKYLKFCGFFVQETRWSRKITFLANITFCSTLFTTIYQKMCAILYKYQHCKNFKNVFKTTRNNLDKNILNACKWKNLYAVLKKCFKMFEIFLRSNFSATTTWNLSQNLS